MKHDALDRIRTRWMESKVRKPWLAALAIAVGAHILLIYGVSFAAVFGVGHSPASAAIAWVSFATVTLLALPEIATIVPISVKLGDAEVAAPNPLAVANDRSIETIEAGQDKGEEPAPS